jgi:hypothetical protein
LIAVDNNLIKCSRKFFFRGLAMVAYHIVIYAGLQALPQISVCIFRKK